MRQENELRYQVSLKGAYKIFYVIFSVIAFIVAFVIGIMSIEVCDTIRDYCAIMFLVIFFVFCGIIALFQTIKRVEVYKGKVMYIDMFHRKTFRLSELRSYNERTESFRINNGAGIYTSVWDVVATFYNKDGKKLFCFGLAYKNVDLLKRDVNNVQKSIAGRKKK